MDLRSLYQKHFVDLYREGFVDDQFTELQKLQDENNPEFLKEVITIYFEDCEKIIGNMARALEPQIVDFKLVDSYVHQLKGSSSSVGAVKIKNACITFRAYCEAQNREGCLRCLQQVSHEYAQLKNKYETISGVRSRFFYCTGKELIIHAGETDCQCWFTCPFDAINITFQIVY